MELYESTGSTYGTGRRSARSPSPKVLDHLGNMKAKLKAEKHKGDDGIKSRVRGHASPFKMGRNPGGKTIPPATSGPKPHFISHAPVPNPRTRNHAVNAEAGSSRPRPASDTVQNSRRPLDPPPPRTEEPIVIDEDETHVAIKPRTTRQSNSPEKRDMFNLAVKAANTQHAPNYKLPKQSPQLQHVALDSPGMYSNPGRATYRTQDSTSATGASTKSGSVSPRKSASKSPAKRPLNIDDVIEEQETIENPDGPFSGHDSIQVVDRPEHARAPIAEGTRARNRKVGDPSSISPVKRAVNLGQAASSIARTPVRRDNGQMMTTTGERAAGPSNSARIPSSDLPNTQSAELQFGTCVIGGTQRRLRVTRMDMLHDRSIVLSGKVGKTTVSAIIPFRQISYPKTCVATDHPYISFAVNFQNNVQDGNRQKLHALVVPAKHGTGAKWTAHSMTMPRLHLLLQEGEDTSAFALAFRHESCGRAKTPHEYDDKIACSEMRAFGELAGALLEDEPDDPVYIDPTATERKTAVPPKKTAPGSVARQKMELDEREYEASASRNVKGKGKQRERDADQPKISFKPPSHDGEVQASRAAPSRKSTRIKNTSTNPEDLCSDTEEPKEVIVPPKAPDLAPPPDRDAVLFPYPLTGRSYLNITKGERWRVMSGEFLNDTLIEWGLRNLLHQLGQEGPDSKVHLFNSFFYNKISSKDRKMKLKEDEGVWPAYQTVRKWTKSVDVFDKDYIIVPINEDYHWYLAVIINPGAILKGPKTRAASPSSGSAEEKITSPAVTTNESAEDEIVVDQGLDAEDAQLVPGQAKVDEDKYIEIDNAMDFDPVDMSRLEMDESADELDCIPRHPPGTRPPTAGVQKLDINADGKSERRGNGVLDKVSNVTKHIGNAIKTFTMEAFEQQHVEETSQPAPSTKPDSKKAEAKKSPKEADHKIWESGTTWVITFDSLGSTHKGVGKTLNDWLHWEAKNRKPEIVNLAQTEYTHAQVPLQPNFSDCGLYLVHYARRLLNNPETILRFVERRLPHKKSDERRIFDAQVDEIWGLNRSTNLREDWEGEINSLETQWAEQQKLLAPATEGESGKDVPGEEEAEEDEVECVDVSPKRPTEEPAPTIADPPPPSENVKEPQPDTLAITDTHIETQGVEPVVAPPAEDEPAQQPVDSAEVLGPTTLDDLDPALDHFDQKATQAQSDDPQASDKMNVDQSSVSKEDAASETTISSVPSADSGLGEGSEQGDVTMEVEVDDTAEQVSPGADWIAPNAVASDHDPDFVSDDDPPTKAIGPVVEQKQVERLSSPVADEVLDQRHERLLRNAQLKHALNDDPLPAPVSPPRGFMNSSQRAITKGKSVISIHSDEADDSNEEKEKETLEKEDFVPVPLGDDTSSSGAAAISIPFSSSRPNPFALKPTSAHDKKRSMESLRHSAIPSPSSTPPAASTSPLTEMPSSQAELGTAVSEPPLRTRPLTPPAQGPSVAPWQGDISPKSSARARPRTKPKPLSGPSLLLPDGGSDDDLPSELFRSSWSRPSNLTRPGMVATTDLEIEVDGLASVNGEDDASNKENKGPSLNLLSYKSPTPPPPTSASRHKHSQKPDGTVHHPTVDDDSGDIFASPSLPVRKRDVTHTYGKGSGSAKKTNPSSRERQTQLDFPTPPMRKAVNNASRAIVSTAVTSRSPAKKRKGNTDRSIDVPKRARSNLATTFSHDTPRQHATNSGNSQEPIDIGDDED